ncbi:MAG: tetratricopeptide repeat protein [Planctomycetes bacterium]|nr:tetratricopeptide repeat protein [Planctomycetota bacterium]MBI3846074.1 tetratricopeptide repeat protein [Planctomycetota bacterium]
MNDSVRSPFRATQGRTTTTIAVLAALVMLALLALSPLIRAAEFEAGSVRLESLVPDDCYFFASFGGVDHCERNAASLGLYQLWQEPEVQAFAKNIVTMVRSQVEQPGMPVSKILDLMRGRVSIAVGDQTLVKGVVPVPAFVIGVDTGNKTEAFRQSFSMMLDGMLQHHGGPNAVKRSTFRFGQFEINDLHIAEANASLCYTYVDSMFLLGLNKYYLQRVLGNIGKANARTLEHDEAFHRTMTKLGNPDSTYLAYVNFRGFTNKLGPWMPPEVSEYLDLFGIHNVDGIALASVPAGTGSRELLYVDAPGEKTGLLRILAPKPAGMKALAFAPPETAFFLSTTLDLKGAYDEAMHILQTVNEQYFTMFQAKLHGAEGKIGLSLEKDLLAALGGEVSLFAGLPAGGGVIPEVVAVVGVKDRAAFERCLAVPLSMAPNLQFKTLEYEGSQVKYLPAQAGGPPITPSYAIVDDLMVIGTSPNSVKQVIHSRTEKRPCLADNPEFKAARAQLIGKDPCCFQYIDLKRIVTALYATAAPFLQGVQGQVDQMGIPVDMALLPTVDTLAKHLSAAASAWSSDGDGILAEGVSPFGLGAISTLAFAAASSLEKASIPDTHRGVVRAEAVPAPEHGRGVSRSDAVEPSKPSNASRAASPSRDADRFYEKKDWANAVKAYRSVVEATPNDGSAWFNLGFSLHSLREYDDAIQAFQKAAELNPRRKALSLFNVACGYAQKTEKDHAFEWLRKALDAGLDPKQLEGDSDLEGLRGDPRFGELTKKVY